MSIFLETMHVLLLVLFEGEIKYSTCRVIGLVTSILYLCLIFKESQKPNVLNLQLNLFGRFAQIPPPRIISYKESDRQGGVVDLKAQ